MSPIDPPRPPPYRALVVDDEAPARAYLRELLGAHPEVEIVGEAKNGLEALTSAQALSPQLIFLDVQMPKLDGFEVLELLDPGIAVVFATAYDQYALRAFEVNAVDYLLKPFSQARFDAALARAINRVGQPPPVAPAKLAEAARPAGTYAERLVVKDGAKVEIIPVDRLDYAQGRDDYVELYVGQRSALKQQTLQSLEQSLDPKRFVRIHRSYLLNLDRLARLEVFTKDSKVAVLHDGRTLPVSKSGEGRLREALGE